MALPLWFGGPPDATYRGSGSSPGDADPRGSRARDTFERNELEERDAQLAARIREGDPEAFRAAVISYFAPLIRFAAGMLGDRDAAEDVVQETLARMWERRGGVEVGISLRAYLYGAVRNRALNTLAHDAMRVRSAPTLQADLTRLAEREEAESDPDHAATSALRAALATLTERRRVAIQLRYEEGLTYPEIAAVMRISTGSAEQLVFHAIRALRAALGAVPRS
jgi:RNA polymerase sigma-70 factor, ECF subfamily